MENRFLIVADDFTGASDTGVQLRRYGQRVCVMSAPREGGETSVVLDMESRPLTGEAARAKTAAMVARLDLDAFSFVVKKVDSTLRGHIAEEVAAIDAAYHSDLVIFAPALPDLHRTTVGGVQRLGGVPVTQTEMAKDPQNPVTDDDLASILRRSFDEKIIHVGLATVRQGGAELPEGARVFTFDAETNEDLQSIIRMALARGKRILWIGTAGMTDNLMGLITRPLPAVAVCGSVNSVTQRQIREAERAGIDLVQVAIPALIPLGEAERTVREAAYRERVLAILASGWDVVLLSSASYDAAEVDASIAAGRKNGMEKADVIRFTQEVLGRLAAGIAAEAEISGMLLTGGDTAVGFLRETKADGSEILADVAIGIPLMRVLGGTADGLRVITKSGAFGNPDAILLGLRRLKEAEGSG